MKNKLQILADRDKISVAKLIKRTSRELYLHIILYIGFIVFMIIGYFIGISMIKEWKIASFFIIISAISYILIFTLMCLNHLYNIIFNHEKYVIEILESEYDDLFNM